MKDIIIKIITNKYLHMILAVYWSLKIIYDDNIIWDCIMLVAACFNTYIYTFKLIRDENGELKWKDK